MCPSSTFLSFSCAMNSRVSTHTANTFTYMYVYMHTLYYMYNSVIEHIIQYNYNQGSAQG